MTIIIFGEKYDRLTPLFILVVAGLSSLVSTHEWIWCLFFKRVDLTTVYLSGIDLFVNCPFPCFDCYVFLSVPKWLWLKISQFKVKKKCFSGLFNFCYHKIIWKLSVKNLMNYYYLFKVYIVFSIQPFINIFLILK